MSTAKPPPPVVLVAAITAQPGVADSPTIHEALSAEWGEIADVSPRYEFDAFTRYYVREMGTELVKWFVRFEHPISPDALPDIKHVSNRIEQIWVHEGRRRVNIDPGYLTSMSLILASTKSVAHRIYIRDGIYGENAIHYETGAWRAWSWTYPDFKQTMVTDALTEWRTYALELKNAHGENANA
jgi:hypothetical protein